MYRCKVVRDLFWSITSLCEKFVAESLELSPLCSKTIPDDAIELWRQIATAESTKEWLLKLDKEPKSLLAYAQSIQGVGRAETYYAVLIQFFIAHRVAPAINLVRRDVRLGSSGSSGSRLMRLQLLALAAKGKKTHILHVEPCLLLALDASSLLAAECGHAAATRASTAPVVKPSALVMFDLQCNVEFRVRAVVNKIKVAESPTVRQWARTTFLSKDGGDLGDVPDRVVSIAGFSGPAVTFCATHFSFLDQCSTQRHR